MNEWKDSGGMSGNQILEGEKNKFAISYLGNAQGGVLGSIFAGDREEETALLIRAGSETKYLILNGDYRTEYEAVIDEGLEACLAVFRAHPEDVSTWSGSESDEDEDEYEDADED